MTCTLCWVSPSSATKPAAEDRLSSAIMLSPSVLQRCYSALSKISMLIYISADSRHLPHGFYEDELRGFFSQFGDISRLRVSRNKKTGKSKNYAFVEFKSPEVAAIAAEAMDGYFLYKQKLVCHLMAAEDQHETLFKGANRHFAKIPWRRMECRRHNKQKTPAEQVLFPPVVLSPVQEWCACVYAS